MVETYDQIPVDRLQTTHLLCEKTNDSTLISDLIIDRSSLFKELLSKEQTTMTIVWRALVNNPLMRPDEALLIAFFDSKEQIAREQHEERVNGKLAPLMSLMLIDSGLVTKRQIEDGLVEQRNMNASSQPHALLGEILIAQLKTNIERTLKGLCG